MLMVFIGILVLVTMFGCSNTGSKGDKKNSSGLDKDRTEPIAMENVTFHITDELKDYMDSQGIEGLALVASLCRS